MSGSSQCNAYWMEGDKTYECEKNILEGRIKSMAKELNIARKCVRKESKEIEAKNKEFKFIIWLTTRGSIPHIRKGDIYLMAKKKSGINKQSGLSIYQQGAKFNSESQLICFKYGELGHQMIKYDR